MPHKFCECDWLDMLFTFRVEQAHIGKYLENNAYLV